MRNASFTLVILLAVAPSACCEQDGTNVRQDLVLFSRIESDQGGTTTIRLAPPLRVREQGASPIQSWATSLIELTGTTVRASVLWYKADSVFYATDTQQTPAPAQPTGDTWLGTWMAWPLWVFLQALKPLLQLAEDPNAIDTWAILVIALIAAFLTVVQVWQIPPVESEAAAGSSQPAPRHEAAGDTEFQSPFSSRFGKTVIAGLGGLAATTIVEQLESAPTDDLKLFYIVCFAAFFFVILFVGAAVRGVIEALRYHLTTDRGYRYLGFESDPQSGLFGNVSKFIGHYVKRLLRWILSLGRPLFVAADTFFSSIQGKNQTRTRLLQDDIIHTQRVLQETAEAARAKLQALFAEKCEGEVRVNFSVLSKTDSEVLYLARSPGSSTRRFRARSIASLSIRTGLIRWYRQPEMSPIANLVVLLNNRPRESGLSGNANRALAGEPDQVFLGSYYQPRPGERYEAFIVFPVPFPRRAFDEVFQVKGGIHVSFEEDKDFSKIWSTPERADNDDYRKDYFEMKAREHTMHEVVRQTQVPDVSKKADDPPATVTAKGNDKEGNGQARDGRLRFGIHGHSRHIADALGIAIAAYGVLLQDFKEEIFVEHIEPQLRRG